MATVLESLNSALLRALTADERVILLGEDILDPYGGAFKVTRGLSSAFPERVWAAPISEAGMVGLATGLALRGFRPVVEIMFGDFLTLAADQLVNQAAKLRWMYNMASPLPLVVRTPMGGRRGYGPTHSQTLEKHFLGAAGLQVLAPFHAVGLPGGAGDPGALLFHAVCEQEDPTLFVENKLQYLLPLVGASHPDLDVQPLGAGVTAPLRISVRAAPKPVLTLAAYGYMAELACQALVRLAYEQEIFAELVVYTRLAPWDGAPLQDCLRQTQRLLTVEEGSRAMGWGAEVSAAAAEALGSQLRAVRRVGARETPVPASPALEKAALPGLEDILQAVKSMV